MKPRLTSIEVFDQIAREGLLTKMQRKALLIINLKGPLTGSELNELGKCKSLHKRISELNDCGVIRQAGRKTCSVTGRSCMAWEASGAMPHETLKTVGKNRQKDRIKELQHVVNEQKRALEVQAQLVRDLHQKVVDLVKENLKLKAAAEGLRSKPRLTRGQLQLL